MGFVRVLHHHHFDLRHGRIVSYAFKNSSDGSGISVIDAECADLESGSVCQHIARYYPGQTDVPAFFWRIPDGTLPAPPACRAVQRDSASGDRCHFDLQGLTDRQSGRLIKNAGRGDLRLCTESGIDGELTAEDIRRFAKALPE